MRDGQCCAIQHPQQSPFSPTFLLLYISSDLCCFSMQLFSSFLSEAAKSGEAAQGDDRLHYRVTESQRDVPVLLQALTLFEQKLFVLIFEFSLLSAWGSVLFIDGHHHHFNLPSQTAVQVDRYYLSLKFKNTSELSCVNTQLRVVMFLHPF